MTRCWHLAVTQLRVDPVELLDVLVGRLGRHGASAPFSSENDTVGRRAVYGSSLGRWEKLLSIGVAAASNCESGPTPTISSIVRSIGRVAGVPPLRAAGRPSAS